MISHSGMKQLKLKVVFLGDFFPPSKLKLCVVVKHMEQIIYSAVLDLGVYSREIIDMFADSYKNIEVFIKSECLDDQVDLSHDMMIKLIFHMT